MSKGNNRSSNTINPTAASLLGFLHNGPQSGWDVSRTALLHIGSFWNLTQSQVYRELQKLARDDYVERLDSGPRDRQPYQLTDKGRKEFAAWVDQIPKPEQIRFPLLLQISFGRYTDDDTLKAALNTHRTRHARQLAQYQACADTLGNDSESRDTKRIVRFGVRYETMVIDYIDELLDELDK